MDDDSNFCEVTKLALASSGYEISEASSSHEALNLARQLRPDLILLDVLMSGLDGYQTCRQLKTNPATSHIPVIVLTAMWPSQ